jgi:hypothetical protein
MRKSCFCSKGQVSSLESMSEVYRWSDRPVILTTRVPNHNYQLHKSNDEAIKVERSPSKSHNWCSNRQVSSSDVECSSSKVKRSLFDADNWCSNTQLSSSDVQYSSLEVERLRSAQCPLGNRLLILFQASTSILDLWEHPNFAKTPLSF